MADVHSSLDGAWIHFVGPTALRRQAELRGALTAAGVNTDPLDCTDPDGCGVLVFDAVTNELCEFVQEISREGWVRILAISSTAEGLVGSGPWRLLESGASDVFAWDHCAMPAEVAAARFARWWAVDQIVEAEEVAGTLVGRSAEWNRVLRQVVEVAAFTNLSVLLTGESGTGKELVARLIHRLDRRPDKRELVILDCTTVVPTLSGSEFFGHERGSFTGATSSREGVFAVADGGTLFLDEIGELALGLQAELLRVIQEGAYKRVGSNVWQRTQFRLVCATNRDLVEEEQRGAFRRDFYHRIAAWQCHLPSLRERTGDILPLARHFLDQIVSDRSSAEMDLCVQDFLLAREYFGNVRELRQLMERIAHRHVGPGPISVGDVPPEDRTAHTAAATWDGAFAKCVHRALLNGHGLKAITGVARETAIRIALQDAGDNLQQAARVLGVTDRALQMRRAAREMALRSSEGASTHLQ
jgi:transcriptional regulator with GAF, ATPase, and Fis domain